MNEEEDVPDHMLISRGGPPRRTLEQIEQGSNYEEGYDNEVADENEANVNEILTGLNSYDRGDGVNEGGQEH